MLCRSATISLKLGSIQWLRDMAPAPFPWGENQAVPPPPGSQWGRGRCMRRRRCFACRTTRLLLTLDSVAIFSSTSLMGGTAPTPWLGGAGPSPAPDPGGGVGGVWGAECSQRPPSPSRFPSANAWPAPWPPRGRPGRGRPRPCPGCSAPSSPPPPAAGPPRAACTARAPRRPRAASRTVPASDATCAERRPQKQSE